MEITKEQYELISGGKTRIDGFETRWLKPSLDDSKGRKKFEMTYHFTGLPNRVSKYFQKFIENYSVFPTKGVTFNNLNVINCRYEHYQLLWVGTYFYTQNEDYDYPLREDSLRTNYIPAAIVYCDEHDSFNLMNLRSTKRQSSVLCQKCISAFDNISDERRVNILEKELLILKTGLIALGLDYQKIYKTGQFKLLSSDE